MGLVCSLYKLRRMIQQCDKQAKATMENIPLDLLPYDVLSVLRGSNRYFRDMASDNTLGLNRMEELVRHFSSMNAADASWRIDDLDVEDIWGLLCHLSGGEMLFPALDEVNVQVSGYLKAADGASMGIEWEMWYPDGMQLLRGSKMTASSLDELHAQIRQSINTLVVDRLQLHSFTEVQFDWIVPELRFITIDPLRRQMFVSTRTTLSTMTPEIDTDLVFIEIDAVQELVVTLVKRMMNIWY